MVEEDDIKYLLESLNDEDSHVKVFTINVIVENKDREKAIPRLMELLYDSNEEVRSRAAWGLGRIGSKASIEALIQSLNDDKYTVRKNAVRALGEIMAFDAIPNLVMKLKDKHWEVRNEAALALEYLSWVPTNLDEEMLILIAKEKWDELVKKKDLNLIILHNFLNDTDKDVRANTARILGVLKDQASVQLLFDLFMTDSNFEVKETASLALSKIGSKKAIELLQVALHDTDWIIRKNAVTAIGNVNDPSSLPLLEKLLEDDNEFVKKSANQAINKIKKNN